MKSADLIRELQQAGWELARINGSHHIFKKAGFRPVSVPHPKKDLRIGLVKKLRRDAGLEESP